MIERQEIIARVKDLIGKAELEQALQVLDDFALSDSRYANLHDEVVHTQARLSLIEKDVSAGVISFDDAKITRNQVTQQILAILDQLEEGEWIKQTKARTIKRSGWLIPALIIALIAVVGVVWQLSRLGSPVDPQATSFCPDYEEDTEFRVLILPYLYFVTQLNTHQAVRLKLGQLRDQYDIKLESEIYKDEAILDGDNYPANSDEASVYGEQCQTQLIIWGTESVDNKQNRNIITSYKFLLEKDTFELSKLKISDTSIDTIQSISNILTQGKVTGEIEQTIKYLFGVIKFEKGDLDAAIAELEQADLPETDTSGRIAVSMLLADCYVKKGDKEKAVDSYDKVLDIQPEYGLALNNRAVINYTNKQYERAAADQELAFEQMPEDPTVVANAVQINLSVSEYRARKYLREYTRIAPENRTYIAAKGAQIDSLSRKNQSVIDSTQRILKKKKDVKVLKVQMEALRSKGNFGVAIENAEKILQENPRDKEAYLTLLEAYARLGQKDNIERTLREALQKGGYLRPELLKDHPALKKLVDKFTLQPKGN